jgi:predicted metal-dependent HD superfamily phosphohydrolase
MKREREIIWVQVVKEAGPSTCEPQLPWGRFRGTTKLIFGIWGRYMERHRYYHNKTHLSQCLQELRGVSRLCADFDLVEMAIYFHDAIYDTHAHDNEERSADLFAQVAQTLEMGPEVIEKGRRLILATKHQHEPVDIDEQIIVDIDLAILGQPWERFEEYEKQIRQEYEWVPEETFRSVRAGILKGFLEREHIYATPEFRARYEARARENLNRSIMRLSKTVS